MPDGMNPTQGAPPAEKSKEPVVSMGPTVDDLTKKYIAEYRNIVFIVLVVLLILVFYMWWGRGESFSPTATMDIVTQQQSNLNAADAGLTARAVSQMWGTESMAGGQGNGPQVAPGVPVVTGVTDPSSNQFPGSASWQVLNSPAFGCAARNANPDAHANAWGWMNKEAQKPVPVESFRPSTDDEFSKTLVGL